MRIHLYTVCWNSERMVPYFLRHYEPLCERLTFYDNMSTDRTRELIQACPKATLRDFDTQGQIDQANYLRVKNEAYKESRGQADFVIVVDIDEFVFHPTIRDVLSRYKREGINLPRITGFNMVSLIHPRKNAPLTTLVRRGRFSPQYGKQCVFSPELDINYLPGAHKCHPEGDPVPSGEPELRLLHYHYLGIGTVLARYKAYQERLSEKNRRESYSVQYKRGQAYTAARFLKNWLYSRRVI